MAAAGSEARLAVWKKQTERMQTGPKWLELSPRED
jgi:hypothetical protein